MSPTYDQSQPQGGRERYPQGNPGSRGNARGNQQDLRTNPKRMTAKYPGMCRVCGLAIAPGNEIFWYGNKWATHVACDTNANPHGVHNQQPPASQPAPSHKNATDEIEPEEPYHAEW